MADGYDKSLVSSAVPTGKKNLTHRGGNISIEIGNLSLLSKRVFVCVFVTQARVKLNVTCKSFISFFFFNHCGDYVCVHELQSDGVNSLMELDHCGDGNISMNLKMMCM